MRTKAGLAAVAIAALCVAACSDEGNVFTLAEGDCFSGSPTGEVSDVDTVECTETHDNEVFSTFEVEDQGDDFPGAEVINGLATEGCLDEVDGYIGTPIEETDFEVNFLTPSEESWGNDDREIVCILVSPEPTDGSARA